MIGRAGAGKTTTMRTVAEIYEGSGARVVGMSLSAVAAENLRNDARIESRTIASWTHAWRAYETAKEKFLSFDSVVTDGALRQLDWYRDLQTYERSQLRQGDVIIVDEAGMAGTTDWKEILDAAAGFGAKVIAVGDDNQFQAISAGDCLRKITDQNGNNHVFELTEIRRQEVDWMREASTEFSKLNTREALVKYENNGKLYAPDDRDIANAVAEKYLEFEKLGSVAVLCYRRNDCRQMNSRIRSLKKQRGELGEDVIRINDRSFSVGERIMFLENSKKLGVRNGQYGILIDSFKNERNQFLQIRLENGNEIDVDTGKYNKIDHGYAITLHKSQGKTIDNVVVIADKMMDASAAYVAMTRHRKDAVMFYKTSDFADFKALSDSLSKYRHKDLTADFTLSNNENKTRVYEYKNGLMEISETLKEIHTQRSTWKKYRELKTANIALGKEIAGNYDAHKLYLNQIGITKESLEISIGLRQRPLTNVELNAKNTVELYGRAARETREFFAAMKKEQFNVMKHRDYAEYSQIREIRNDLAREILSNWPLHREFVGQFAGEYFISRRTMEKQIRYAESLNRRANSVKQDFLQKLENAKENSPSNYKGESVAYFMEIHRRERDQALRNQIYSDNFGYAPHVSKSMVYAFGGKHNLNAEFHRGDLTCEYASMIVHGKMQESGLKEPTPEIINESIKEAVCFQALRRAKGEDLSGKEIPELSQRATILAKHITGENIHILTDKNLMKEAISAINPEKSGHGSENKDPSTNIENYAGRIAFLGREDAAHEKSLRQSPTPEPERSVGRGYSR
jgi:nucleoside-triphosphatase THEP1